MIFWKTKEQKIEALEEKLIKAQARLDVLSDYNATNNSGIESLVSAEQMVRIYSKRLERLQNDN